MRLKPTNRSIGQACALLVALLLVAAGCSSGDGSDDGEATGTTEPNAPVSLPSSAPTQADDETVEVAQARLDAVLEAEGLDGGAVVLTVIDGETIRIASGTANGAGDPLTPDHQFRVGSISKPFVATMVLQMVEEGLLDLSDPLSEHLPDAAVGGDVTIEQLLSHRSGLPNYTEGPGLDEILDGPLETAFEPADVVELIADVAPDEPGGSHHYSNTNYILLGQLVEQLDARSLNDALEARITKPLELGDTFFAGPDTEAPTNLAGSWWDVASDGDPDAAYTSIETLAWAAGSLVSTADDLAAFLAALRDDELLEPTSFEAMSDFETNPIYGLGLSDITEQGWIEPGWGHGGSIPGFISEMVSTTSGDTYIILTNNDATEPFLIAEAIAPDAFGGESADEQAGIGSTVDDYLNTLEDNDYQGVVLIQDGGDVISHGFGFADREAELEWDENTVFDIGSITKQFTGAAILRLEMDGALSVEDTLSDHLDGLPAEIADITLHQLLTHTAGFPGGFGDDYEAIGRDEYVTASVGEMISEPGDGFSYSNTGYSLLGAVIETITGDSYEVYLQQALFEPAGMANTGYVLPDWDAQTVAVGYGRGEALGRPNEQNWDTDGPYWHLRANGGILSTAEDMFRWHEALLTEEILDEAAKAKFYGMHVQEFAGSSSHYGYGWSVVETPEQGLLITHNGGNGVFFADFLRFIDDSVTIFVATNDASGSGENVASNLAAAIFGTDPIGDDDTDCGLGDPSRQEIVAGLEDADQLDDFPDTDQGRIAAWFTAIVFGDRLEDADVFQFFDDHTPEDEFGNLGPEERLEIVAELRDEFDGAEMTNILAVDDAGFRMVTSDPDLLLSVGFLPEDPQTLYCVSISG